MKTLFEAKTFLFMYFKKFQQYRKKIPSRRSYKFPNFSILDVYFAKILPQFLARGVE
jgi:hypothetical protein